MPPEDDPTADARPTREEFLARDLVFALDKALAAQREIGELWAASVEVRTPRMAEVVTLLARAASKLRAECKKLDPKSVIRGVSERSLTVPTDPNTPGRWEAEEGIAGEWLVVATDGDLTEEVVCICETGQAEADARLVAAAKD